jgi:hypothetical protein
VADPQGLYLNLRADIYFGGLRQRFREGTIDSAIAWDDEVISQLSSLRLAIESEGKV